jgi:hypothetical protein
LESESIEPEPLQITNHKFKTEHKNISKSSKPIKGNLSSKSERGGEPIEGNWSADIASYFLIKNFF